MGTPASASSGPRPGPGTRCPLPLAQTCASDQPHLITGVQTTDAPVPATELRDPIHTPRAERDLLPAEHLVAAGEVDAGLLVSAATAHQVAVVGPVPGPRRYQLAGTARAGICGSVLRA
jgi:hypothetical protein